MKTLKIILLILGISLLTAGVYKQDGLSNGAVYSLMVSSLSAGMPSWDDMNHGYEYWRASAQTGAILKLIGLAILFTLFFMKLRGEGGRENRNPALPTILGLASAICFATYTVLEPTLNTVLWAMRALVMKLPLGLDARGFLELRNAHLTQGITSATGIVVLAVAFFLLAAAMLVYRRGAGKLHPAMGTPLAFFALTQGRQVIGERYISYFDVWTKAGVFFFAATVLPIAALAIFIKALLNRKKTPQKVSLLAAWLLIATGCVALVYWITFLVRVNAMFSADAHRMCAVTAADIAEYAYPPVVSASLFYMGLLLCTVFISILCALSLCPLPTQTDKTEKPRKFLFPIIAGIIALVAFGVAGLLNCHENQYKAVLRDASLKACLNHMEHGVAEPKEVTAAFEAFESEDGLRFLHETMNDPKEFFWHELVSLYMWKYARSPKARERIYDMLLDNNYPIASAWAGDAILNTTSYDPKGVNLEALLSDLACRPELGASLFELMIQQGLHPSSFVFDIIRTCNGAGVSELKFNKGKKNFESWDDLLDVPVGFAVHYRPKLVLQPKAFVIKLLWEGEDWVHHRGTPKGRVVLEADGRKFKYAINKYGEEIPDYKELEKVARESLGAVKSHDRGQGISANLVVAPLVPSGHIRLALNALAKAGITGVSIVESK